MGTYHLHVSDAGLVNAERTLFANAGTLPKVIGAAISEMIEEHQKVISLPLFIDLQAQGDFANCGWVYQPPAGSNETR